MAVVEKHLTAQARSPFGNSSSRNPFPAGYSARDDPDSSDSEYDECSYDTYDEDMEDGQFFYCTVRKHEYLMPFGYRDDESRIYL